MGDSIKHVQLIWQSGIEIQNPLSLYYAVCFHFNNYKGINIDSLSVTKCKNLIHIFSDKLSQGRRSGNVGFEDGNVVWRCDCMIGCAEGFNRRDNNYEKEKNSFNM